MKKTKLIIVLAFFMVTLCVVILTKGFSFGIGGVFFKTTKYYDSAIKAFSSEYVPSSLQNSIVVNKQIDIIDINENNCLLLATTEDKELLIASMVSKNDKFAFTGDYYVYDYESKGDYEETSGLIKNETNLYNANGKVIDTFEWCVLFEDKISLEKYEHKYYNPEDYKDFVFVFVKQVIE